MRKLQKTISVDTFSDKADKYFANTDPDEYTLTGLLLELGISKKTFYKYRDDDNYTDLVEKCQLMIENKYEKALMIKNCCTGALFALKNFGWTDRQETVLSGGNNAIEVKQDVDVDQVSVHVVSVESFFSDKELVA